MKQYFNSVFNITMWKFYKNIINGLKKYINNFKKKAGTFFSSPLSLFHVKTFFLVSRIISKRFKYGSKSIWKRNYDLIHNLGISLYKIIKKYYLHKKMSTIVWWIRKFNRVLNFCVVGIYNCDVGTY